MAPEAEAFSGYENPVNRYGERTYVTVQGLGIHRIAGTGPGETQIGDFKEVSTSDVHLPDAGTEYGDTGGDIHEEIEGGFDMS